VFETKILRRKPGQSPVAGDLGPAGPRARGLPQKIGTRQGGLLAGAGVVNGAADRLYQQSPEDAANALILGTKFNFWACQFQAGIEI
jgi:hypothetical protein